MGEIPLHYAGTQSTYAGQLPLTVAGPVTVEVLAMDAANANFGRVSQTFTVGE